MSDINFTIEEATPINFTIEEATPINFTITETGPQGVPGEGVPVGGSAGQALVKIDGTDYNTEWSTINSAEWGAITGTLSSQTDLQNALNDKYDASNPDGFITSYTVTNSDLTGLNISELTNDAGYITSQLTTEEVQDIAGPLVATGGTKTLITVTYDDVNNNMDFVVNDDLSLYDNSTSGFITDYTVTEADVTQHEAALSITESQISDLTHTTPAGTNGQVQFNSSGSFGADADLIWDGTNKRLGIGSDTPNFPLTVIGKASASFENGIGANFGGLQNNALYPRAGFEVTATATNPLNMGFRINPDRKTTFLFDLINGGDYAADIERLITLLSSTAVRVVSTRDTGGVDGASLSFGTQGTSGEDALTILGGSTNVGVGTTSPLRKLHVTGSTEPLLRVDAPTTNNPAIEIGRVVGNPSIKSTESWFIADGGGVNGNAGLNGYTTGIVSLAAGGGNVGIGTFSPSYKLQVEGNTKISGNLLVNTTNNFTTLTVDGRASFGDSLTSNRINASFGPRSINLIDSSAAVRIWRVSNSAVAAQIELIKTTNAQEDPTLGNAYFSLYGLQGGNFVISDRLGGSFGGNGYGRFWIDVNGDTMLSGNGNSATLSKNDFSMVVEQTGNVGINTVAPTEKLHVVGNAYFEGGKIIMDSATKQWEITVDDGGNLTTTEVV